MTKTSKAQPITFPLIAKGIRRNAETGIEIHSAKDDLGRTDCTIYRTEANGTLSYWGSEFGLAAARVLATERVETVREQIAELHAEALDMDAADVTPTPGEALKMRRIAKGVRRHVETGVEVVALNFLRSDAGRYEVRYPAPNQHGYVLAAACGSLALAREVAADTVYDMQCVLAAAYVEAQAADIARTDALVAEILTEVEVIEATRPEGVIVNTLLFGAKASAGHGFLDVARKRLDRAKAILDGTETVPGEVEVLQARDAARAALPLGTRVLLADGTPAVIDNAPNVEAETGRVFVGVRAGRAYVLRYVETLRKA